MDDSIPTDKKTVLSVVVIIIILSTKVSGTLDLFLMPSEVGIFDNSKTD